MIPSITATARRTQKRRSPAAGRVPSSTLRAFGVAFGAILLVARVPAAPPLVECGVLGRVGNVNYQSFQSKSTIASVSDGRREDIEGGGKPAGSTISTASAVAEFGNLHLTLLAKATAEFVSGNFWGHDASTSGNCSCSDVVQVQVPGAPSGTPVEVIVAFAVEASVSDVHGGAYLQGTLALQSDSSATIQIEYQNTGPQAPISSVVIDRQVDPVQVRFGEEYAIARLRTGTLYTLTALLQGSVSAAADINPGYDPSARIPFSQGVVDAANTAHVGLKLLTPGATLTTASKATYDYADLGPALLGSDRLDGDFVPVADAQTDLVASEITVPIGGTAGYFRLSGRIPREVRSVELRDGRLRVRY